MRRGFLLAGLIVIAANGLALSGVAYNRSAEVERVELTEAELPMGSALPDGGPTNLRFNWVNLDVRRGAFSEAQLRAAGFALPPPGPAASGPHALLPHRAAVALSVGGSAQAEMLANFDRAALPHQIPPASALILVDVGRDLATLRAAHPDPHTLVVWGEVAPQLSVELGGSWAWHGELLTLEPNAVHVPKTWRAALSDRPVGQYPARYIATVAVGRTGEPWLIDVRPR